MRSGKFDKMARLVLGGGLMRCVYKSIDTEQNTSETWGFDLCFLRGFVSRQSD
jgi:hypothetical protein